jgi:hypothetical protein
MMNGKAQLGKVVAKVEWVKSCPPYGMLINNVQPSKDVKLSTN